MANQTKSFAAPGLDLDGLVDDFCQWLENDDYKTQSLKTEEGNTLVQLEQRGGWRKFTGMSTALNVVFSLRDDNLNVEIGAGQWIDKIAGGTVGMLVLWPLAVTTAIGIWNQSQMPDKIFRFIGDQIRQTSARPTQQPTGGGSEDDLIAKLERLGDLKAKGILTEEEFLAQKKKLLEQ
ncbi:MAG: hypothetical protein OHK0039_48110 [Bacteroidia bacterium]